MAAAAVLVAVTSVLMGLLGTVLLRDYLYSRVDAQLRTFSMFASKVVTHPRPAERTHRPGSQLPTDFLVEVAGPGKQVRVAPGSIRGIPPPALTAAQLRGQGVPFTTAAAGAAGHSWRVVVQALPGGRHLVTAFSLDEVQSTYDRAKADVASLEAQVKQERVQLQYFRVLAPTAGVVGDIPVHVGDRVTTSTPTGPGRTARPRPATPRTGCAGSSPTPATNCAPR